MVGMHGRDDAYLEHLYECNAEIKIRLITANETRAVKDSYGNDSSDVGAARHLDFFAAV